MTNRDRVRLFALEARYEIVKVWRTPGYTIPALTFPLAFYLLFGVALRPSGGARWMDLAGYLVATYGACGVMGAALQSFGVGLAIERGQGWLLVKRASPMPLGAYFVAKLAMVIAFGTAIILGLALLATLAGDVRFGVATWLRLGATLTLGMVPFAALGLLLGVACGPNAIGPVVNLVFMAGSAASGLWMPVEALPSWWQRGAVLLPPYHYGRLALAAIGIDSPYALGLHVLSLAAFTVIVLGAAWFFLHRAEERS